MPRLRCHASATKVSHGRVELVKHEVPTSPGERQREIEEGRARVKELLDQVEAWHLAGRIREYVWAVQVRSGAIDRWWTWALAQADRIDPRVPSPPLILDEADG